MFKAGDKVICIQDVTGETPEVVLKSFTISEVVEREDDFRYITDMYPDYRFHTSELQLITEN